MVPSESDPDRLPADADERLREARSAAVDLIRVAEDLEAQARDARRRARSKLKNYERLLSEYHGQTNLLDEDGVT